MGLPEIVGLESAATTKVASVTNAAVTSAAVPDIIIASDTVTVPVSYTHLTLPTKRIV